MIEKIIEIIKNNVDGIDMELTEDTKMISKGYLDSFAIISLISELETVFNVNLDLENLNFEDFNTVRSISEVIDKTKQV